MMDLRYDAVYVCIRRSLREGFGYLSDWETFQQLITIGQAAPCTSFLVDAGNDFTEAAHADARRDQSISDYGRERLRTPRFSYAAEHQRREQSITEYSSGGAFLELVLAGGRALESWHDANRDRLGGPGEISLDHDPMGIHCHTPLNQRLLPAHMRICQHLVKTLGAVRAAMNIDIPPPMLAAICWVQSLDALGFSQDAHESLCEFGFTYLACYLADADLVDGTTIVAGSLADQIDAALGQLPARGKLRPPGKAANLPEAAEGFLVPESLWMQMHWFVSCLGVSVFQELALTRALAERARRKSVWVDRDMQE